MDYEYPDDNEHSLPIEKIKEYNSKRVFGPQKRICYAVFNNMHFQVNGDVTLCSFNKKLCIGNVRDKSLLEIWNSKEAEGFRQRLKDYNLEKCQSCKISFFYGNYSSFPPTKYDFFANDHPGYPNQMSFEISNLCNYECIMCNEDLSSLIRKRKNLPVLQNPYTESFVEQLEPFIPYLKIATFIGGEPLLIKSYYTIWETILKLNKDCSIHIQTNGSVLPEKFMKFLDSGQFEVGVSLDAVDKDVFEKIRKNSKFEEVQSNVERLIQYYKKGIIAMNINFCLMSINWEELTKMLVYCNENNISLKIIQIDSPFNLDIKNQSPAFVEHVYEKLSSVDLNGFKNTVLIERNINAFVDVVRTIGNYRAYARSIENKIQSYGNYDYQQLESELANAIFNLDIFAHFHADVRNELYVYTMEFINRLPDDNVKKRVIIRILIFLYRDQHDMDEEINYKEFERLLNAFCALEIQ